MAARTLNAIRDYLETDEALRKNSIDTYLQGSYKNSTNVRGESVVDMGGLTENIFYYDVSELPQDQSQFGTKSLRESVTNAIEPASFTYQDYRRDGNTVSRTFLMATKQSP